MDLRHTFGLVSGSSVLSHKLSIFILSSSSTDLTSFCPAVCVLFQSYMEKKLSHLNALFYMMVWNQLPVCNEIILTWKNCGGGQ